MNILGSLRGGLAGLLLAASCGAQATVVTTTLSNVTIGAGVYDVTFWEDDLGGTTFDEVFGAGASPQLAFTTLADAQAAVTAVLAAVTATSFDFTPATTSPAFAVAYAYTASSFTYLTGFTTIGGPNGPFTVERATTPLGASFATFARAGALPEPSGLALAALALAAAAVARRRRD